MHPIAITIMLLTASNVFMTFAWYAHLRTMPQKAWYIAALVSWGIALFEYYFYPQVTIRWTAIFSDKSIT